MQDSLIHTKLHLPFLRAKLVPRARLRELMAQGLHVPLTLITAPAGFGKTTIVASCASDCGIPVAWLSLDADDNQPGRFQTYLVAALQETDPGLGKEARQLLTAAMQADPEAVLTSLINDLEAQGRETALVLDDYQFINHEAVHQQVTFLLEHCPKTLHLMIATRSDPPLPLARLRARGQIVELRASELRFTQEEAAHFLNEVMDLCLEAGVVTALAARTEGWIAGLQMAALSMHDRHDMGGFIASFSGTNRYILDYLLEEVLANQPPEIQHFLLRTSILERLTPALCDFLLEDADTPAASPGETTHPGSDWVLPAAAILEHLERANLFLVPLDQERTWFRYHHLFADLLRARLQQTLPGLAPQLHQRASAWLEENGFIPQAIHHRLASGELEQTADLIERYGPAYLAASDGSVFQMAHSLPREMILARPKIALYQAWLLIIESRIREAFPLLQDTARQLAGSGPKPGQRWMQTVISTALAFLAPPDKRADEVPLPEIHLLDEIPDNELILRNAVDFLYGMALARRVDFERAVAFATQCIEREKQLAQTGKIPTLASFLSRLYLMKGRLHACAELCRAYLDPIREQGIRFVYTSGSMKIDMGEVLYEWDRLAEAEQYIRDGLLSNEPWRNIMTDGFGYVALTRLLSAKGDFGEALQVVEKLETRMRQGSLPREFEEDYLTLRARVQLASGDLQAAVRWADQVQRQEDYEQHKQCYRLSLSRVRLAQGNYSAVEELLNEMEIFISRGSRITRQVERDLLLAAALAGQQRIPQALQLVETALSLAEAEGYQRIFLEVGEPARELLAAYQRSNAGEHQAYARKILEAFAQPSRAPDQQPTGLIEPLSMRELEVLQHMALGRTNQEIARQLIISTGTVKAHGASIYRKLDVANRTEAVTRARQLGLLV